jgi:hypothetical protein
MAISLAKPDLFSRDTTLHSITDFMVGDAIKTAFRHCNRVKSCKALSQNRCCAVGLVLSALSWTLHVL